MDIIARPHQAPIPVIGATLLKPALDPIETVFDPIETVLDPIERGLHLLVAVF